MDAPTAPACERHDRSDTAPLPTAPDPSSEPQLSVCFPIRAPVAYALAVATGLLYFLSFPGLDLWPLAFITLVPLRLALEGQTVRRATALGWVAGFVMTMTGFYWLLEMLRVFSGFPTALCALFMSVLCAYQAGRFALLGWLFGRMTMRGWPAATAFFGAFATSELVFPLLFPWYFGASVHQLPVLLQVAEIGGPILVGVTLASGNLAIWELVVARLKRSPVSWRRVAGLSALVSVSLVYGAVRIPQVDAQVGSAPKATVGTVQADMSLFGKRRDKQEGLRRHLNLTRSLKEQGPVDLVVWSETSVVGAVEESAAEAVMPRMFTRAIGAPAIFGGVLARPVNDARRYVLFNSALVSDAQGNLVDRYDKRYLLAFGEYLPWGDTFPILYEWSPNSGHFAPGTRAEPVVAAGHSVAVLICYEDILPSYVNTIMGHANPELLVNMTNDAWFGNTTEPWIHLALAQFRAVEQRRYLVRSVNSGVSAFVDPVGRVVSHTQPFVQATLRSRVAWLNSSTCFRTIGQAPWWLLALLSAVGAFVPRARLVRRHVDRNRPSGRLRSTRTRSNSEACALVYAECHGFTTPISSSRKRPARQRRH
ncbi:MAG: apolipoprotein N-acyltransferase [Polyangiaceae bacterium]|nr:apolipoprotein N-acyltransferase [Polyangiaceae bacterium]